MNELEFCRCEYKRPQRDMLGHLSSASICEITRFNFKDDDEDDDWIDKRSDL